MPSESQIRNLVRSIIDEALADGSTGSGGSIGAASKHAAVSDGGTAPACVGSTAACRSGSDAIAIGGDHGGYALKESLAAFLLEKGWKVQDCGTSGTDPVDYPDIAYEVARLVAAGECRWGIVIDGAGIGSAMVANKVPGIRAALCYDISSARNSREHNHANVLTLGAGLIGDGLARQIVTEWLATGWGGGRHARRVEKISAVERRCSGSGVSG